MTSSNNKIIYEVIFKVKSTRSSEFEKHCKDVMNLLDNHSGFCSLNYSKRVDSECDSGLCMYRAEIIFDSQDSLNSYLKNIVPKIRSTSTQFGDDARVAERRTYKIFCTKTC